MRRLSWLLLTLLLAIGLSAQWDADKQHIITNIDQNADTYFGVASEIWNYAELGYQEVKSSSLLQTHLADSGFKIEKGVGDMPTAFVASYGSGSPV